MKITHKSWDHTNLNKLPWIPNIGLKIKREFKKIGKGIFFKSGKNLQQILRQKNKPKLLLNSQPRVYRLDCSCNVKYIAESRVLTRCIEHQHDSTSGKWESSGATEHTKEWHGQFDWLHPKTVRISPYMYERKIHEGLEINKLRTINEKDKNFTILNRDNGDYFTTNSFHENWKPLNCGFWPKHYNVTFEIFQFENGFF